MTLFSINTQDAITLNVQVIVYYQRNETQPNDFQHFYHNECLISHITD